MELMITGAKGFMGRNLTATLRADDETRRLHLIDVDTPEEELRAAAAKADFVFHLAGVNRPKDEADFMRGNGDFTHKLLSLLQQGKRPPVLLSSSTQAALQNPYGQSKREAEEAVRAYGRYAPVYIYRLTNVFGKWSRPNYNSAVATFCYNLSRDLPITVSDPDKTLKLVYVDDVVAEFLRAMEGRPTRDGAFCCARPEHEIELGRLAELLCGFRAARDELEIPDQSDPLTRKLYATYLSFEPDPMQHTVSHCDARGSFTELLHMGGYGQVSVNVSKPGITKGEHWHHTKHEKFIVVSGTGVIRLRKVGEPEVHEYAVCGETPTVVDILPGMTHNIENTGKTDLITLMWASERFDPERPDTYRLPVDSKEDIPQ